MGWFHTDYLPEVEIFESRFTIQPFNSAKIQYFSSRNTASTRCHIGNCCGKITIKGTRHTLWASERGEARIDVNAAIEFDDTKFLIRRREKVKKTILGLMLVGILFFGAVCTSYVTDGTAAEAQPTKSLYDRLGGVSPISVVVDTFIDLLFVNDVLNANPAIKAARDRVPRAVLKYHVTALVCQETGGPCKYTGRGMKESHAHLNISEKEWQAMLADFRRAMNNYGVPAKEQQELLAIVESTKKDIVVRK